MAEGIRLGREHWLLQSPLLPLCGMGSAPVGKGDETGRFVRPPRGRPGLKPTDKGTEAQKAVRCQFIGKGRGFKSRLFHFFT